MSLPPSVDKTVLITGISGYAASAIGLQMLSSGYNVRGTTRSKASTAALLDGAYKKYASRVEIVEILDPQTHKSFDEAVKGVSAIHHTASPSSLALQSWDEWVTPAVDSCNAILRSAYFHAGYQLRSFVFLSASIVNIDPRDSRRNTRKGSAEYGLTEADRQDMQPEVAVTKLVQASKTETEKVIWRFREEYQPPFSICSICPSNMSGPPTQLPSTPSALNISLQAIWALFSGKASADSQRLGHHEYVDVRDVAKVYEWCAQHPDQVDNERYLVSAGLGPPQAVLDILRAAYPEREHIIAKGQAGQGYLPGYVFLRRGKKSFGIEAGGVVGLQYIRYDQSILETARILERYLEQV